MSEQNKVKVIVGAFLLNENNELLLRISGSLTNKYTCLNQEIDQNEDLELILKNTVEHKTKLSAEKIEFLSLTDAPHFSLNKNNETTHYIFLDYLVYVKDSENLEMDEDREYKWLSAEQWLKMDKKEFAPLIYTVIEQIELKLKDENFEHKYRLALADYQNLLKQTAKEKMEFGVYANEQLLYKILPVYDNLKMAITHGDEKNHDAWLQGVKYVIKQFKDILADMGVEEIKTEGEKFDHNFMEAVSTEETDDEEKDDMIASEVKAGYRLNGKVIMPARVVVFKYKE
jgi:molecular chaperone GrpE